MSGLPMGLKGLGWSGRGCRSWSRTVQCREPLTRRQSWGAGGLWRLQVWDLWVGELQGAPPGVALV